MKRIIAAFKNSMAGLLAAFKNEAAFREEAILAFIMIPLAFFLAPDALWLVLMVSSVMLVLIVELLNTGIEAAIDRISEEIHPLSKIAKDVGSAAVFLALLLTGFVWIVGLFKTFS